MAISFTLLVFKQPLSVRMHSLFEPYSFNGDALQHIAPTWYLHDAAQGESDYISRYYLNAIQPALFKGVYWILTLFWIPPIACKIVTVALSVLFICVLSLTSFRLAGLPAAFLTLLFATGGTIKNFYFMGGLQRSFGMAASAIALYFVATGNIWGVFAVAVISSLFYPAAAVFILVLLGVLLFLPKRFRGTATSWSFKRRCVVLCICGALMGLFFVPQLKAGKEYGARLSMANQDEFQEWGQGGRYTDGDRGVEVSFFQRSARIAMVSLANVVSLKKAQELSIEQTETILPSADTQLLVTFLFCIFCSLYVVCFFPEFVSSGAVRLTAFFIATLVAFSAASLTFPLLYIPSRYIGLGISALAPVAFPALLCGLVGVFSRYRSEKVTVISSLIIGVGCFWILGWPNLRVRNLPNVDGYHRLMKFVGTLPIESRIAAWPRGVADMIQFFTGRHMLLTEESHQVFHREYAYEMRRRMTAIVKAFAATDLAPIQELVSTYQVTHLLIDLRELDSQPSYFVPFKGALKIAREKNNGAPLILNDLIQRGTVYKLERMVVVDLKKVLG